MTDLLIKWGILVIANAALIGLALSLIRIKMDYWYVIRQRQLLVAVVIYLFIVGAWLWWYYPNLSIL